jgi:hypothetical protein
LSKEQQLRNKLDYAKKMLKCHNKHAAEYRAEVEYLKARVNLEANAGRVDSLYTGADYGNGEHTHGPNFGKYVPGCPRCDELKNGATPKQGRCAASRGY